MDQHPTAIITTTRRRTEALRGPGPGKPLTISGPAKGYPGGMGDSLDRLYAAAVAARSLDLTSSRTAWLFRAGRNKMAKKLVEEAAEVALDTRRARKRR
jgi:hypothetical protein